MPEERTLRGKEVKFNEGGRELYVMGVLTPEKELDESEVPDLISQFEKLHKGSYKEGSNQDYYAFEVDGRKIYRVYSLFYRQGKIAVEIRYARYTGDPRDEEEERGLSSWEHFYAEKDAKQLISRLESLLAVFSQTAED